MQHMGTEICHFSKKRNIMCFTGILKTSQHRNNLLGNEGSTSLDSRAAGATLLWPFIIEAS